jgi:hypothetical protein
MQYSASVAPIGLIVKSKPKHLIAGLLAFTATTLMTTQSAAAQSFCTDPECYQSYVGYSDRSLLHKENGWGGGYVVKDFESEGYGLTSNVAVDDYTTPEGAYLYSSASASLSSGSLHVSTAQSGATTYAVAKTSDIVKFSLPTGTTSALATISFTIEGINDYIQDVTRAGVDFDLTVNRIYNSGYNRETLLNFTSRDNGKDYYDYFDGVGFHTLTLTQTFAINADDLYQLAAALEAFAYPEADYVTPAGEYVYKAGSSAADYGNTAFFSLSLPEGVTFESASSTFLSSPYVAIPVPEPSGWALMICGFGLIGLAVRKQRVV